VVQDAHGDIGGHVGFARQIGRLAIPIGGVPAAVGELRCCKPFIGPGGGGQAAADTEPHSGFDVIPGIRFSVGAPGNFAGVALAKKDVVCNQVRLNGELPLRTEHPPHDSNPCP